ncbi:MAG: SDR family NAD(P)-dependent oxidoreductase, partial [Phycisphaerales bacterium]
MIQGLISAMLLASIAVGAAGAPAQDLVAAQRARIAERAKSPRTPAHVAFVSNGVAAKGAQTGWTRSMATEVAPWQVTVNAVAPGW